MTLLRRRKGRHCGGRRTRTEPTTQPAPAPAPALYVKTCMRWPVCSRADVPSLVEQPADRLAARRMPEGRCPVTTFMIAPQFGVLYRSPGADYDSLITAATEDERDGTIAALLARGVRGKAVALGYDEQPQAYAEQARQYVLDAAAQVADADDTDAAALTAMDGIAHLAPALPDADRALWFGELLDALPKSQMQPGDLAWHDRDADWDGKTAEAVDILAGLAPAPAGVSA